MKTLIAGFGNLLLGDDGFGVEVIRRLGRQTDIPDDVELIDVGIGGFDFVIRLMDGYQRVIIVDAVCRRQAPGTLHVFRPKETDVILPADERIDPHFAEPARAMILARKMSCLPVDVTVVGCEPLRCDLSIELSEPVEIAVAEAIETIRGIVSSESYAV